MEIAYRMKRIATLFGRLKEGLIFVEGKKDRKALEALGFEGILTISGNLRQSCGQAAKGNVERAFVLSDLDRRGDELAKRARDELGSLSIKADTETRVELAHLLRIRCFEDAKKAYDKLVEEMNEEGENNG